MSSSEGCLWCGFEKAFQPSVLVFEDDEKVVRVLRMGKREQFVLYATS